MDSQKLISGLYNLIELEQTINFQPTDWRPLVFTNGCFDLLHTGHIRYLWAAKSLGRSLIVGLNSDRSVQKIKPQQSGYPVRPIIPQDQRAEVLVALKPVDGVVMFDETTATHLIERLKPDIYVKGGDYSVETLPEASIVMGYGGKISLVQIEVSTSTTAIINRILDNK
ncbi:MAG: D-glycero-beta-D-manno-heptose 1-phosphate adenylyltransferase [Okeania sp. SIO2G4]|uniref:D-glycero-beta-D-manno-heptose 1-phosphate adenylyltransferase n=1 Tax=unclassified Okeania TaxID=2634635 RepID=UPI0013B82A19|nr:MULTISPECIES: D-glycero-beta-D-manno-heptose 1-phosphate adenylyltransferase [unclassified Okeania]NEP05266.1 D-glycero-beta-D-manno-heptose 1-phosphate adenylyltransferase [Okeania sp. SIO4D6]NEP39562.1 D-glycero-beta-D-manno-heptose 1-phosphate adenylyltransferase [Okeania sp. SIO2H7]NEP75549.1 D-glycero-beta-D-manno-heptose 1-phosphate adenylyltransferase [Okeania sp. SIO2G5]NEP96685.1 D-glycero-beta-D-manno-heptose 1-phosphate adenylyltransferase [Okeania sp. SIO2F5]NEQ94395.1 D-glycero